MTSDALRLDALTSADVDEVRRWRNQTPEVWRTPFPLTMGQQQSFYQDVVCDRRSLHRYWALVTGASFGRTLIGMGGLTYIEWENGRAELSLVIDPAKSSKGLGHQAVPLLLAEGFGNMGLQTITAEVYACNGSGLAFWTDVLAPYKPDVVILPRRKRWAGKLLDSTYFTVTAEGWAGSRSGN